MRALVMIIAICLTAGNRTLSAQARLSLDWQAVAEKIVERMALQPDERVLLVAHPGMFEELIPHLRYAVVTAGAIDVGVTDVLTSSWPRSWDAQLLQRAHGDSRAMYRQMFRGVDVSVMLPGASTAHAAYGAIQDLLRAGRGRTIHFHWLEGGGAIPLPGQSLPALASIDSAFQHALLSTDYTALASAQRRFERAMRNAEVRVTTPAGTDLWFRIGSRPVNKQDGDASRSRAEAGAILIDREIELPAGAVRVAPVEETVHGTIVFPPSQWNGQPVRGLTMHLEAGRVVGVTAESGADHAKTEMRAAGEAGRRFREFALGFNPTLAVPERFPWIPYYGYGAGVVRLSLGDNSELGGTVTGGYVRWNFFVDATVTVGDDVWVRDGELLER